MDMGKLLEKAFGELKFYAALNKKLFAEIIIEDKTITIEIINAVVMIEAMIEHIFKKHRFSSLKLKTLKDAGYRIVVKYRGMKFEI